MFHASLSSALTEATPLACQALLAQGIRFAVAVENNKGEWFLLHADDQFHAADLAHHWVHTMGARGASCRRIFSHGVADKPFHTVFEDAGFYEEEEAA